MEKPLWIISLTLAFFWVWTMPALAESPTAYARGILDKVMSLQNDASLSSQARATAIHGIVERSFDFTMMAKNSLGPAYDSIAGGQRQEFTAPSATCSRILTPGWSSIS